VLLIGALGLATGACGRARPAPERSQALPVDVYADTGRGAALRVVPPSEQPPAKATVWLARVSQSAPPAPALPPPAEAETLSLAWSAPPALAVDENLKPPIPRSRAPLAVPQGVARGTVELDVRVDEAGGVSDALWAGGSRDSSLVRAAIECALAMRFYPALRAGHPVAVWCRQRFDFGRPAETYPD
jgi:TonB family protein